jgi:hypothetical protein
MTTQVLVNNNLSNGERMLLIASLFVEVDKGLRYSKKSEQINRTELLLLCRILIFNRKNIQPTKRQLLEGWRIDYKRLKSYLERLSIKGYISIAKQASYRYGFRLIESHTITFEGLRILREVSDRLSLNLAS